MYKFMLLILCAIIFGKYSKSQTAQPRIHGGNDTIIEEHPYNVAVLLKGEFICSGALITSSIVLTTAHYIVENPSEYSIRAGSDSAHFGGQVVQVRNFCNHPKYLVGNPDYDISVLKLDDPVNLNSRVGIIELQPIGIIVPDGAEATVTGWGIIESEEFPDVLQSLTLKKVAHDKCANLMDPFDITPRMTCYAKFGEEAGVCEGDEGGPLVINRKLVGIASWGSVICADPGRPSVFVRIEDISISMHIQQCINVFTS